jgi:hypothetical protein
VTTRISDIVNKVVCKFSRKPQSHQLCSVKLFVATGYATIRIRQRISKRQFLYYTFSRFSQLTMFDLRLRTSKTHRRRCPRCPVDLNSVERCTVSTEDRKRLSKSTAWLPNTPVTHIHTLTMAGLHEDSCHLVNTMLAVRHISDRLRIEIFRTHRLCNSGLTT